MRTPVQALLSLVFCCCALFASPAAAAESSGKEAWPVHLRFLSGPSGGQWHAMGDVIAETMASALLPCTSRVGGGLDNIKSINAKTADFAFSLTGFLGAAASNEPEYQSITLENTALLANVYPQVLYILVRKDFADKHGITTVEDLLRAKTPTRFASLRPGTASEFILTLVLKHGYGMDFDTLRGQGWTISFNNYAETADNLVAGDLDCFAYTAGTDVPLIHTMTGYTDLLILPMSKDVLDKLAAKFKTAVYTIQPGEYKGVAAPVTTLSDYTCLIVRKDLPDSLVYAITKTLWESKARVAAAITDFGALAPQTAVAPGVDMHPGALRFWREQGAKP